MAVTSVKEIRKSRNSTNNIKNEVTYTRVFQVECDSPDDGPKTARLAVSVSLGDAYSTTGESDSLALCIRKSVESISEDGQSYHVTCEYGKQETVEISPLDEPAEVNIAFSQYTRVAFRDVQGTIIANAAGEPYSADGHEIDDARPTLTLVKNHASFNFTQACAYKDAVNSGVFGTTYGVTIPARCAKVASITAERKRDQTYGFYWRVTYVFSIDFNTYDLILLNEGYNELKDVDGTNKLVPILKGGVPVNAPALLASDGTALPENGTPVFRNHKVYNPLPFSIFEGL